ncbi:MAG: hypothetical protein ABEJ34_00415 [Haloferacaceae archaeon]
MSGSTGWLGVVRGRQSLLWATAVLCYGVGDGVTTFLGLRRETVVEAGPVALRALEHAGFGGVVLVKLALFAAAFAAWRTVRTPGRAAIPLALAVTGALVTAWNAGVLLS